MNRKKLAKDVEGAACVRLGPEGLHMEDVPESRYLQRCAGCGEMVDARDLGNILENHWDCAKVKKES